ncbi:hypothetical protein AY599_13490 [Leptolyngbya valderiana BDU 20041]|nr:hypothetical protein AY599_13490 [Leptolyngbya valderiana BDU 20041]
MRHALFWPAFALTLPQALWVRRTARHFDDASGPTAGRIEGPDPLRLCGIGDSIIAGVGCRSLDQALIGHTARALHARLGRGVDWRALGRTGSTTGSIHRRLVPALPEHEMDLFIVSAGVNDITALTTLPAWSATLTSLFQAMNRHSPNGRVVLLGIPPMHCFPLLPQPLRAVLGYRARSFDVTAAALVEGIDFATYVPFEGEFRREQFAPDGYHPSEDSCAEIAEVVIDSVIGRL